MRLLVFLVGILCLFSVRTAKKNKLTNKTLLKKKVVLPKGFKLKSIRPSCLKKSQFDFKTLTKLKKIKKNKLLCAFISFQANAKINGKISEPYRDPAEALSRFKLFSPCIKRAVSGKKFKDAAKLRQNQVFQFQDEKETDVKLIELHKCDLTREELDKLDWLTSEQLDDLGIVLPDPRAKVPKFCLEMEYHENLAIINIRQGSPDEDYYCAFVSFQAREDRLTGKYNGVDVARMRLNTFKDNVEMVNKHNSIEGVSYIMSLNMFSDITPGIGNMESDSYLQLPAFGFSSPPFGSIK